jgi:DNA-binding response OmpR family regulator
MRVGRRRACSVNEKEGVGNSSEVLTMAPFKPTVLCIDTETSEVVDLQLALEAQHYSALTAINEFRAFELFSDHFVDAVIIGEHTEEIDVSSLVVHMKKAKPHVPIVLVSGYTRMSENARGSIDAFVCAGQPRQALLANLDRILHLNTSFFSRWFDNWRLRVTSMRVERKGKKAA